VLLSPAALLVPAGESGKHVVKFDTITLTAVLGVKQMKGLVLRTTEGAHVAVGGANPDTLYLDTKNSPGQHVIVPDNVRSGSVRIALTINERKASIQYGNEQLTRQTVQPVAGQIEFHGGEQGFAFAYLTIAGKVNPEWAATFFSE
jgi:hypothetical protein